MAQTNANTFDPHIKWHCALNSSMFCKYSPTQISHCMRECWKSIPLHARVHHSGFFKTKKLGILVSYNHSTTKHDEEPSLIQIIT